MQYKAVAPWLSLLLLACGQGGRALDAAQARAEAAPQPSAAAEEVLPEPLAELLEPTGLSYRLDVQWGRGPEAVHSTHFGLNGLPLLIDADRHTGTGNALGADIWVQFSTLFLSARLQVDLIGNTPVGTPLRVEATVLDPRNLLGLPAQLGLLDPDLRAGLSLEALEAGAPASFSSSLSILDSAFDFLPRFTSARLEVQATEGGAALGAGLSLFADRAGQKADNLDVQLHWRPAVDLGAVDLLMAPDAEESALSLSVSSATDLQVDVDSSAGLLSMPSGQRDIRLQLDGMLEQFDMQLFGVDGFDAIQGQNTRYQIQSSAPLPRLALDIRDWKPGEENLSRAVVQQLPREVLIVRTPSGGLQLDAVQGLGDIAYAQSRNTPLQWRADADPAQPFQTHLLEQVRRADGSELLQARVAGLKSLNAEFDPDLLIDGELQPAPLVYRAEDAQSQTDARLERLPQQFSVRFPEDTEQLRFEYSSSAPSPALSYSRQDTRRSTTASIQPLPAHFSLCAADDDSCGSHGDSTDSSIAFSASESMRLNFHQRSADGSKEIQISELVLQHLNVDLGTQQGARRGYLYFDTQGANFHGSLRQLDGDGGLYLRFSDGTWAEGRRLRFKNYIQIDQRSGSMRCPGREELEVRSGGRWYDLDFVLDELCQ